MTPRDAERILAICQAGLDVGDASVETVAPTWAAFERDVVLLERRSPVIT
ncbi:hypothetical protein [Micromonospora sp. NPDC023814]